ncbi:MAG: hypothetical protein WD737_11625 [Gemmatimonadota bacterium]
MSLSSALRARAIVALLLLGAAACGSEAETAQAPASSASESADPLTQIPPAELYGASPVENLWSPRFELEVAALPAGWDGARIAVLADFRVGLWEGNEEIARAAVQRTLELEPDIVVLFGDFVEEGTDAATLADILAPLNGRVVLAALGGGDVTSDSLAAELTRVLEDAGVEILRNEETPVVLNSDTAWVAGLDPDVVPMTFADQQWVLSNLGQAGRTPILLTQVPAMATRAPEDRFPVVLASNAFCGDVEVPGTPRLSWIREEALPGAAAEGFDRVFQIGGSTILITCGLGYGFVPLRFGAPPEVPLLTLVRAGAPAVEATEAIEDSVVQQFQPEETDSL